MDWPPSLTENEVRALVVEGTTYALAHGLAYLPLDFDGTPMSAIHAPFTLVPTLFPKRLFDRAIDLQPVYNRLYSRIASHTVLLDSVLGDQTGVGRVDHFTGRLWKGWKDLRDQGAICQVSYLATKAALDIPAQTNLSSLSSSAYFALITSSILRLSLIPH